MGGDFAICKPVSLFHSRFKSEMAYNNPNVITVLQRTPEGCAKLDPGEALAHQSRMAGKGIAVFDKFTGLNLDPAKVLMPLPKPALSMPSPADLGDRRRVMERLA